MTSTRRIVGSALWVVSLLGLALVVASIVGNIFDLDGIDPPGPGFVYGLITVSAAFASQALLEEKEH